MFPERTRTAVMLAVSWILIFFVCILMIEAFFFGSLYRLLPPAIPFYQDRGINIFSQYSKRGDLPEHYIAIFGDSYAEGQGDWGIREQSRRMPDTQATHLLYKATGRDVVTFGVASSGSVAGYLLHPDAVIAYVKSLWFYDIKDPEIIFLYFYEGNDIIDNYFDYKNYYEASHYDPGKINDLEYFEKFYKKEFLEEEETYQQALDNSVSKNFIFSRTFYKIAHDIIRALIDGTLDTHSEPDLAETSDTAKILVGNKALPVPDRIQTAPLDRTEDETRIALAFFQNSIRLVARKYPSARIGVILIPSPGTIYHFATPTIETDTEKLQKAYPTTELVGASNRLCKQVREVTLKSGLDFHDARPAFRDAATDQLIHGPVDWNHFSEPGYRILAAQLLEFYKGMGADSPEHVATECASLE